MIKELFEHVTSAIFWAVWLMICLLLLSGLVIFHYLECWLKMARNFMCRKICNCNCDRELL